MDLDALRSEFPVLERIAYLNTGSNGPVPKRAASAAKRRTDEELREGRASKAHWETAEVMKTELRQRLACHYGARPDQVAVTSSTTGGVNAVLQGLDLGPGDVILTTDEEHPGLLAPLATARAAHGVEIRTAPFARLGEAAGADTALVACSHVSWQTGAIIDTEALKDCPAPVLLDGAQGLGAIPLAVEELGCDFYAASGQKWLCGPEGTGSLYVREPESLGAAWTSYTALENTADPLALELKPGAARFDAYAIPGPSIAWALASLHVLDGYGLPELQDRAIGLATELAAALAGEGLEVAPRGATTLVSWRAEDPEAESARLLGEGLLVRHLPGTPWVRASVGGWTGEEELERLVTCAARA